MVARVYIKAGCSPQDDAAQVSPRFTPKGFDTTLSSTNTFKRYVGM